MPRGPLACLAWNARRLKSAMECFRLIDLDEA
jgi:hypothetical protein